MHKKSFLKLLFSVLSPFIITESWLMEFSLIILLNFCPKEIVFRNIGQIISRNNLLTSTWASIFHSWDLGMWHFRRVSFHLRIFRFFIRRQPTPAADFDPKSVTHQLYALTYYFSQANKFYLYENKSFYFFWIFLL